MTTGCSHTRLIQELGADIPYKEVVDYFQKIFQGENSDGLITPRTMARPRWTVRPAGGAPLPGHFHRPAALGGERDARSFRCRTGFNPVIGADDVTHSKPDPEGLHKICAAIAHGKCWYVGDTVDDARASRAARIPVHRDRTQNRTHAMTNSFGCFARKAQLRCWTTSIHWRR